MNKCASATHKHTGRKYQVHHNCRFLFFKRVLFYSNVIFMYPHKHKHKLPLFFLVEQNNDLFSNKMQIYTIHRHDFNNNINHKLHRVHFVYFMFCFFFKASIQIVVLMNVQERKRVHFSERFLDWSNVNEMTHLCLMHSNCFLAFFILFFENCE